MYCTLKLYTHFISFISILYAYLIFLLTYCCVKFVEKVYDFILDSLEPSLARLVICFRNSTYSSMRCKYAVKGEVMTEALESWVIYEQACDWW